MRISIVDTGKGIAPDDLEKLFHKFGRLDNSYQTVAEAGGTGLGLYIVKSLIEAMGGRVGVTSEGLDKGSAFWFTLSTTPPTATMAALAADAPQSAEKNLPVSTTVQQETVSTISSASATPNDPNVPSINTSGFHTPNKITSLA